MDYRTVSIIAAIIIALMIAGSGWAIALLPADSLVPIHFGLDGRPDGWAPPLVGLALLPAIAAVVLAVSIILARNATGGLARSGKAFRTFLIAVTGIFGVIHGLVIAAALGYVFSVTRIMIFLAGLLFLALGNMMGKVRPNRWFGIRTPWTLADERVWDRTHRFGGWTFIVGGAALVTAAAIVPDGRVLAGILLFVLALVVIMPWAKSYLLWRDRQHI